MSNTGCRILEAARKMRRKEISHKLTHEDMRRVDALCLNCPLDICVLEKKK